MWKKTSVKVRQIGVIYLYVLWKYIYICSDTKRVEKDLGVRGAQVEDEPPERWWLLINSRDRCLSKMLKDGESIVSAVDIKLSELKK